MAPRMGTLDRSRRVGLGPVIYDSHDVALLVQRAPGQWKAREGKEGAVFQGKLDVRAAMLAAALRVQVLIHEWKQSRFIRVPDSR